MYKQIQKNSENALLNKLKAMQKKIKHITEAYIKVEQELFIKTQQVEQLKRQNLKLKDEQSTRYTMTKSPSKFFSVSFPQNNITNQEQKFIKKYTYIENLTSRIQKDDLKLESYLKKQKQNFSLEEMQSTGDSQYKKCSLKVQTPIKNNTELLNNIWKQRDNQIRRIDQVWKNINKRILETNVLSQK